MAGGIDEGVPVKARLPGRIEAALTQAGASPEQIASLRTSYFDSLERQSRPSRSPSKLPKRRFLRAHPVFCAPATIDSR
jgi:hypothetical protein